MHPILFTLPGGLVIPSFGVMLALGFLLALALAAWRAKRFGQSVDALLTWAPLIMLGGLLGGKLLYLAYFPLEFMANPLGVLLYPGGLVWYGGVVGAVAVMALWCAVSNIRFLTLGDWLAPSALLGLALGRVGCFLSGCCYGAPCTVAGLNTLAVQYPVGHPTHPLWVHPTPLYETALVLLLMGTLFWLERRFVGWARQAGAVSSVFLIGYGLIRFVLEAFRGDALLPVDGLMLSASQMISLAALVTGLWLLASRRHAVSTSHPPSQVVL